jgi:hypothetical protein
MKYRKALHAPMIQAAADSDWDLARSIQVTPSTFEGDRDHVGVLIARSHPTGWFVSVRCRPGLPQSEIDDLQDFAARRSYLLFQQGPQAGSWTAATEGREWRSFVDSGARGQGVELPEILPAEWAA